MIEFLSRLLVVNPATLFIAGSLIAVYLYATWTHSHWSALGIPVPSAPVPLFGHALPSTLGRMHFMDVLRDLYKALGDRRFGGIYTMRTPQLLVKDPELIGKIDFCVRVSVANGRFNIRRR